MAKVQNINATVFTNIFLIALILIIGSLLKFGWNLSWTVTSIEMIVSYISIAILLYVSKLLLVSQLQLYAQMILIILQSLLISAIWVYLLDWTSASLEIIPTGYVVLWKKSFLIHIVLYWIMVGNLTLVYYLSDNQNKEMEERERTMYNEQLKRDAELFKLRQQINPHFLFNSLNSVNALVSISTERARSMIQQLAQYFRNTIKKEEKKWITIEEELADIKLYFDIEKVRFGHRLNLEQTIDKSALQDIIPPFVLQPLIENAIKYGLYGTIGNINIQLQLIPNRNQKTITFTISNPFDPKAKQQKGTGFGMASVERRLYLLYGRKGLLKTTKTAYQEDPELQLFIATLTLPIIDKPTS